MAAAASPQPGPPCAGGGCHLGGAAARAVAAVGPRAAASAPLPGAVRSRGAPTPTPEPRFTPPAPHRQGAGELRCEEGGERPPEARRGGRGVREEGQGQGVSWGVVAVGEEGLSQASRSGWGGNGSLWLLTGEGGSRVRGWVGSSVQIHGFLLLSAPFKELCAGAFCASFWGPANAYVQNEGGIETLLKKITVSEKYTSSFRYYWGSDLCQDTDSFPTYCRTLVESLELESPFWRHQSCDPHCCPTRLIPQEQGVCRNTSLHIWSYIPVATIIL